MKNKKWLKYGLLGALLILIFAVGMATGLSIVVGTALSRVGNVDLARTIASYIRDGKPIPKDNYRSPNTAIVIYSQNNEIYQVIEPLNEDDGLDITSYANSFRDTVMSGSEVTSPVFTTDGNGWIISVYVVSGAPVIRGGVTSGAVLIVNLIPEMSGGIVGFLIYYSVFYWIAAISILTVFRVRRKAEEERQNYVANITHSLKTPIAAARAAAETLSEVPDLDEDTRMSYYGTIIGEMSGLNHLVCQILDLSGLQSGRIMFTTEPISFGDAFADEIEQTRLLCDCTGVRFELGEELDRMPLLDTDPKAAATVLETLLGNASKYAEEGGFIRISAEWTKKRATICVSNNGGVIDSADLPHIFERFYKGKNSTYTSNGLGLAIAKETMTALKEKIWVRCVEPDETRFYFTIKLA